MSEPLLTAVFGASAVQTATTITLTKADFVSVGLTASSSNTAESLLAAILLQAKTVLTQSNYDANTDQSITITEGFASFTTRGTNNDRYRVDQLTVNLSKLDTSATIDPDSY